MHPETFPQKTISKYVPNETELAAAERVAEWLHENEHQPLSLLWWAFRRNSVIPATSTQLAVWKQACLYYANIQSSGSIPS